MVLLCSATAFGTTLTYNPHSVGEELPGEFAIRIVFDDNVDGKPDAIRATVTMTPGSRVHPFPVGGWVGDMVALYVDLTSLVRPLPAPIRTIADAIQGNDITARETFTRNVQSGDMGSVYSIGLALGEPGIGNNKGDIRSTEFTFNTPGLELENFADVAVRVTSVGFEFAKRNESRKLYDDAGVWDRGVAQVPESGTIALVPIGIGVIVLLRKHLRIGAACISSEQSL
jgi:hypothetical protein